MQSLAAVEQDGRRNKLAQGVVEASGTSRAYGVLRTLKPPKWRNEMIEQPTSIPWSDDYSDEDEMIDFVVAASEMLEELLTRPQPNYLRSRLIHLHKQSLVFLEDHWLH